MDDHVLLQAYIEHQSEQAFVDLVGRHLPFVYATALCVVRDPHTAQDVAQAVFILLARKPSSLRSGHALPGWLYRTTQYKAWDAMRGENRRRQRETEAMNLAEQNRETGDAPGQIDPVLNEALQCLSPNEQDAVLLHYYQGKSYREIGIVLGLNESAAHKRVERSLGKIRHFYARRGVTTSTALLATAISAYGSVSLPAGLTAKVAGASLAGSAGAGGFAHAVGKALFTTMKIKTVIVALAVISAAALFVSQHQEVAQLRTQADKRAASTKPAAKLAVGATTAKFAVGATSAKVAPAMSAAEIEAAMAYEISRTEDLAKAHGHRTQAELDAWLNFVDSLDDQGFAVALVYADRNAGTTPGTTRKDFFTSLLGDWAKKNPAAAVAFAQNINDETLLKLSMDAVFKSWTQTDLQTALAFAQSMNGTESRIAALHSVLGTWTQSDPDAAIAWIQQQAPGLQRAESAAIVSMALVNTDAVAASGLLGLAQNDAQAAFNQALTLPDGQPRNVALQAVLANVEPEVALGLAANLTNEAERTAMEASVLPRLEPAQALSYIARLPVNTEADNIDQQELASNILTNLARANSAEADAIASKWIQSLPPEGSDLRTVSTINYTENLAYINPSAAASWVGAIDDPAAKERIMAIINKTLPNANP